MYTSLVIFTPKRNPDFEGSKDALKPFIDKIFKVHFEPNCQVTLNDFNKLVIYLHNEWNKILNSIKQKEQNIL